LSHSTSTSNWRSTFLIGTQADDLRSHIGEQVEVTGTLRSEQQVASVGTTTDEKPAKGTAGRPTVKTKSELDVKTLTIDSVKPTGNRCAE